MRTMPLKGPEKICRLHCFFGLPLKGFLLCLSMLAPCKRVYKFLDAYLVGYLVFLQSVLYVSFHHFFVSSYCTIKLRDMLLAFRQQLALLGKTFIAFLYNHSQVRPANVRCSRHIAGRYTEEMDLPWDYQHIILDYLKPDMRLLDMDTGSGEFLLSLYHPHENTSTAGIYPPNVGLCKEPLLPLGIDFRAGDGEDILPLADAAFDMVINRHGDFNVKDIHRMLKDGGIFITEQVGTENDRELVELLLGNTELPFPEQYLEIRRKQFCDAGFDILHRNVSGQSNSKLLFLTT